MNVNLLRRVNWLWKHRHTHDDDNFQEQITIIRQTVESQSDTVSGTASGAYIHLSRNATQSIAVDGEPVEWDTEFNVFPAFEFVPGLSTTQLTVPKTGYYDLLFELHWDTWHGGGDVWVIRTRDGVETQIWPRLGETTVWSSTYGSVFVGSATGLALKRGDVIEIYVDHGDSSAQSLSYASVTMDHDGLTGTLPVSDTYRATVLADSPVGYWRLDEAEGTSTASDETGNGHDGTYDAGVIQGVDGLIANDPDLAAEFEDTNDSAVSIPIHADLKFLDADYTLELWFTCTGTTAGTTDRLLCWDNDWWSIAIEDNGVNDLTIHAYRDEVSRANASGLTRTDTHHVVYTYDASTDVISLYVNGQLKATGSNGTTLTDSASTIDIGQEPGVGTTPNAIIDEVAIYDKVLSSDRISEHYNVGSGS